MGNLTGVRNRNKSVGLNCPLVAHGGNFPLSSKRDGWTHPFFPCNLIFVSFPFFFVDRVEMLRISHHDLSW